MIRKVEIADVEVLAKLAKQTFRETFAHDNTEEQLQEYFEEAYNLRVLSTELEDPDSETYFIMHEEEISWFSQGQLGKCSNRERIRERF